MSTACVWAARACRAPGPGPCLAGIGLPCPTSSCPPDRGRRCLCLFCAASAGCSLLCAAVCALLSRAAGGGTSPACLGEALSIGACFCAVLQSFLALQSTLSRQLLAANKNMCAAAAQAEASFMPAHCSQSHVHCNIFMTSWPLRGGPRGRNACMIAFTAGPNSQDFRSVSLELSMQQKS